MSTLSTSGISPVHGLEEAPSGRAGEALIAAGLVFALSRRLWPGTGLFDPGGSLRRDPELRLALIIALVVPLILFLRHWIGAGEAGQIGDALAALWGAAFTTLSFLTTTGFVSGDWATSRFWSGLETPGLVLAGLAIIGGGVATTAGGVKLLRVQALYRHGERELERLIHPNSIGGSGVAARRLRREGAYLAWVFFMLFALTIAAMVALLTLAGVSFESALVLTLAALTTTGQLAELAAEAPLDLAALGPVVQSILAATMVVGRLEMLAILSLLAPDSWRR